ncbi:hypothetical protein C7M84_005112 [Penaeus vannamei]|uniref:Uncharacterized protein n=1 Tax=Penaeus vannamei TaxID=6689 RepID=A0A3R7SUX8_PENVA|nr:hypothetical protein C7M84_005112 [Penaeus vannamei]
MLYIGSGARALPSLPSPPAYCFLFIFCSLSSHSVLCILCNFVVSLLLSSPFPSPSPFRLIFDVFLFLFVNSASSISFSFSTFFQLLLFPLTFILSPFASSTIPCSAPSLYPLFSPKTFSPPSLPLSPLSTSHLTQHPSHHPLPLSPYPTSPSLSISSPTHHLSSLPPHSFHPSIHHAHPLLSLSLPLLAPRPRPQESLVRISFHPTTISLPLSSLNSSIHPSPTITLLSLSSPSRKPSFENLFIPPPSHPLSSLPPSPLPSIHPTNLSLSLSCPLSLPHLFHPGHPTNPQPSHLSLSLSSPSPFLETSKPRLESLPIPTTIHPPLLSLLTLPSSIPPTSPPSLSLALSPSLTLPSNHPTTITASPSPSPFSLPRPHGPPQETSA